MITNVRSAHPYVPVLTLSQGTYNTLNPGDVWDMSPTLAARATFRRFSSILPYVPRARTAADAETRRAGISRCCAA